MTITKSELPILNHEMQWNFVFVFNNKTQIAQ